MAHHAGSTDLYRFSLSLVFSVLLQLTIPIIIPFNMTASGGRICESPSDTRTYTYSDLDNGFTPPKSCLEHRYTSEPNGYDYYISTTRDSGIEDYVSLDVYRGRNPACFPPNFPTEVCSYTGTFTQEPANDYMDLPSTSRPGLLVMGSTRSETHYVYSPGTCPGDYAPVSTNVDASVANLTRAVCCPM